MKTNFNNKNFALRLALKMRKARTRKWSICFTQQWKNSKGSVFVFQLDEFAIITHNLYSCAGDGRVYQHRTGHFMEDPIDVCALIVKTNDIKVSLMPFERFTSNTACRMSWLRY